MAQQVRKNVFFYLNGKRLEVDAENAGLMLADFLRQERALTGTKIVCAEGDCGACSVLRLSHLNSSGQSTYEAINSCIVTVAQMDGSSLVTIEALAENSGQLNPIQSAMVRCHGSQCGFCTPGFVIALSGLVEKKVSKAPSKKNSINLQEAKNALTGNLCRCTGYQPILEAACSIDLSKCTSVTERFYSKVQAKDIQSELKRPLHVLGEQFSYYAPTNIKDASKYLARHKEARIISAGTDLGVAANKRKINFQKLVSLHLISDLYKIKKIGASRVSVGARVTLSEVREFFKELIPEFSKSLDVFASPQIKNVATLIGNIGNASPIADTPPFLLVTDAILILQGPRTKRKIPLDQFYLGYRKTALKRGEVIVSVEFEVPKKNELFKIYKVSQRKDLDISAVNAAFRINWTDSKSKKIKSARLALGGVAAIPIRLVKTEKILEGETLTSKLISQVIDLANSEINPIDDLRGSAVFRRVIVENLFYKYFEQLPVSSK